MSVGFTTSLMFVSFALGLRAQTKSQKLSRGEAETEGGGMAQSWSRVSSISKRDRGTSGGGRVLNCQGGGWKRGVDGEGRLMEK